MPCRIPANALTVDADSLSQDEVDALYQALVDTGAIWHHDLAHVYAAAALIREGRVVAPVSHGTVEHAKNGS